MNCVNSVNEPSLSPKTCIVCISVCCYSFLIRVRDGRIIPARGGVFGRELLVTLGLLLLLLLFMIAVGVVDACGPTPISQ